MNAMKAWIAITGAVVAGGLLALVGSNYDGGSTEIPLFMLLVCFAFLVQWIAFIPAYFLSTEKFFDALGSGTFLVLVCFAIFASAEIDVRSATLVLLIGIWAIRLGVFLSLRVKKAGGDRRFNTIKQSASVFLMTWTLQGLWIVITLGPALASITSPTVVPPDAFLVAGVILWVCGFVFEVVADQQKIRFRAEPQNAQKYIQTGLWAWSQHPNYFGEILLWAGIAVVAFPVLSQWQLVTLISPVFVWLLLTKISGIRMLDATALRRWGDDSAFAHYRATTPKLIPRKPRPN